MRRTKTIAGALLVIGVLSLAITEAYSQNRSTISGFVFDPERRPVAETYVELLDEVNSVIARVRTDGVGRYFFGGLSQGRFTIKVLSMGTNLEGKTEDVEISGIGASGRKLTDNIQRDIYLPYKKSESEVTQLTGVLYAQNVPQEAKNAYKKAVADLDNKKGEQGVEGLRRAISIFPDYLVALEKLGMIFLAQEKYDEAKITFARAVKVYDRSFTSWYGLGYSNYPLKAYDEAIVSLEKAVNLNGNSMRAYFLLGLSYRQLRQYPKAETALLRAVKASDGDAPEVHWNLALLYAHDLKQYKEAADQLETYIKQSPDLPNKEAVKKLIRQFREKAKIGE